jgi:DNA-binding transcriptional MerR regulator
MNKYLDQLRNDFQGSADHLIATAQDLAKTLKLDQEATEGNERLLRHYVSMGVVDKPSRDGRDALYGFRHLVQFVAARRWLAEGFPLAKIAKFTGTVPTDTLTAYLENPNRISEAELLIATFRSETPTLNSPPQTSRKAAPPKPLPSMSTGMGMVDVMHEMREMEHRVRDQLMGMQSKVRVMVENAMKNMSSQPHEAEVFAMEFKHAVTKLADMMAEATYRLEVISEISRKASDETQHRLEMLESKLHERLDMLEKHILTQQLKQPLNK